MGARKRDPATLGAAHLRDCDGATERHQARRGAALRPWRRPSRRTGVHGFRGESVAWSLMFFNRLCSSGFSL
jgi:hypothetical protein